MISLVGLSPTLLMWFALGGMLLLGLMYLLRLRRRQVVVPFLPLWQRVIKQSQYQSLWQRLKRLFSWLIQVLLLLLLLLALGDPRLRAELLSGRQVVVIVDTSASMQATDVDKKSRLRQANKKALELISGLIGSDRMMLVQMDAEVIPVTPFTSDQKLLREKLAEMKASETVADLRRALLLAKDALQDRTRGEIILISDAALGLEYQSLLHSDKKAAAKEPAARPVRKRPAPRDTAPPRDDPPPKTRGPKGERRAPPRRRAKARSRRRAKARPRARARRRRARRKRRTRKRRTRKGRRGKAARRQPPPMRLPPGLKRRIDVSQFTKISTVHRKLPRFRLIKVGSKEDNVGIVALSARRLTNHPMQFAVYTELQNFGKKPVSGLLEFYVDKLIVETIHIQLKAAQRWRHILPRLTAQGQRLEARLKITKGEDLLPADNRTYAVLPKARPMSVLLVSKDNLYLQAALLSDAQVMYQHIDCGAEPPNKPFDIYVYNECAPKEMPTEGRYLFVAPPAKHTPFRFQLRGGKQRLMKGPIVTEVYRDHPLMRFVALTDLNISQSLVFQLTGNDRAVASSFGKALIVTRETKQMRALAMGFSLADTDMTLRMAFPLFLKNAMQWLMRGGRPVPPTARGTGKLWRISLSAGTREVKIKDPKGATIELPISDDVALFSGKFSGFYQLTFAGGSRLIAANLSDPEESQIKPKELKPMHLRGTKLKQNKDDSAFTILGMRLPIPKPLWLYLLLFALFIIGLEWYTYNRRITV